MDPSIMPDDMADAMDSDADVDSSGSSSGSGCAPKPVPTQYEAFENVRFLSLEFALMVMAYMAYPVGCMQKQIYSDAVRHANLCFAMALA